MEARLKAKELVDKFVPLCGIEMTEIQCALIAVDEIIQTFIPNDKPNYSCDEVKFWQEVRREINKL